MKWRFSPTKLPRLSSGDMIEFSETPFGLWIRVVSSFFISPYLMRSGIWPNPDEPRKWYDRTIRIAGGVILGSGVLFGSARIIGWVK